MELDKYVVIGLIAVPTVAGWNLWNACRRAKDGYEDSWDIIPASRRISPCAWKPAW